ncbi:translation initiation factor IF-1 [Candidatus Phytoplasma luffae]|uniref:Translation initiation factor IF-1 n=1 Tax=Loofah witches'-broom phytoplasma TaxID=35773 RepID=A0A975FIY8_LOWBP|nr:translation initiation factor IF-1 [Candidatus Phytoplasma luffae]QTX02799.1 translation initiation factor IF-1 [Candidatus Phytoplasma luffae]
MINNDIETLDALVVGILPNSKFKLELPDKRVIIAYISGKIRTNKIRILLGDKVKVDYRGRIIFRYI